MSYIQLSLFDAEEKAISLLDRKEYKLINIETWMERIVPQGEYYIKLEEHPVVLYPSSSKNISPGMKYIHYKVGGRIYSSVAVQQN